jgi:coenzyme PQQ precursor peptide PqqA
MREWQKPTVEETESGMEVTSYLPARWIALNPSPLMLGNWSGDPAKAGSPFLF